MRIAFSILPAIAGACLLAAPAAAGVTLTYSADGTPGFGPGQIDREFELAGGYLDSRGLPAATGGSHLVPAERAVVQVKAFNTRNALHLPTPGTGLPTVDGGTGVDNALTNVSPFSGNDTQIGNGVSRVFSITRVGDVLTFNIDTASGLQSFASDARLSIGEINAFSIRVRTTGSGSISYTGLSFTDALGGVHALGDVSATGGLGAIRLYEGIMAGDFTLAGTLTRSWTGTEPNGSNLATQIKFLNLPANGAIPEPATWAMLIAGFGLVGGALRRRRTPVSA